MLVTFLYCIDSPAASNNADTADEIRGWLLCSHPVISISCDEKYLIDYGSSRQDVVNYFREFSSNENCGVIIKTKNEPIDLKRELFLEVEIQTIDGNRKCRIALDLDPSLIQTIEVDDEEETSDSVFDDTENKFRDALKKDPLLTLRMDVTNKCNLKCMMCHYSEKEISSRPVKAVTAEQLKKQLAGIGPYVKHIMLSCGYEPLMSKYFHEIVSMLHENYPQMEIGMCTNGMLMDSKARKTIIEKNITHVILSFDGVKKETLERIRVGANYEKILGHIMALRDLKIKYKRRFPLLFMDYVMMDSNIHEAPAFVEMCSKLGIELIDFRHMVGNVFFSDHGEMLHHHKEKYNYYRRKVLEISKKLNMPVRLPEAYTDVPEKYSEVNNTADLSDFMKVKPDDQTEEIIRAQEIRLHEPKENAFEFLATASCLRPFSEIMIVEQHKVLPCSYYSDPMGDLDRNENLSDIFFDQRFQEVRRKKLFSRFDHNCVNCPIRLNLLPTDITQ